VSTVSQYGYLPSTVARPPTWPASPEPRCCPQYGVLTWTILCNWLQLLWQRVQLLNTIQKVSFHRTVCLSPPSSYPPLCVLLLFPTLLECRQWLARSSNDTVRYLPSLGHREIGRRCQIYHPRYQCRCHFQVQSLMAQLHAWMALYLNARILDFQR
jgi:hypothetical protein